MQDSSPVHAYIPVLIFFAAAALLPFAMLFASRLVARRLVTRSKREPSERDLAPIGSARGHVSVRAYLVATLVLVFEVGTLFLLPWGISLERLALLGLLEMFLFIAILVVGFFHAWREGAFE